MKRTQLILDADQRAAIEKTWEPSTNMSVPQYVERIKDQLVSLAESDLRYARKAEHLVGRTKRGTLTVVYVEHGIYRISIPHSTLWLGDKAGAVATLVNAYQIES